MSLPISGFTAVPNPQMLSYMMSQSWIMMYAAGGAWQFGKRKVGAMSNEEFNKLSPEEFLSQHMGFLKAAIPSIQQSIQDMTPLIRTLMVTFGQFINEAVKAIGPSIAAAVTGSEGGEFNRGSLASLMASSLLTTQRRETSGFSQDIVNMMVQAQKNAQEIIPPKEKVRDASKFLGTSINSMEEARKVQAALDERLKQDKIKRARLLEQKGVKESFQTPTAQVSILQKGKRKAGQSQIIHRKKLIQDIVNITAKIKTIQQNAPGRFTPGSMPASGPNSMGTRKKQLKFVQQQLVNLLSRYQF